MTFWGTNTKAGEDKQGAKRKQRKNPPGFSHRFPKGKGPAPLSKKLTAGVKWDKGGGKTGLTKADEETSGEKNKPVGPNQGLEKTQRSGGRTRFKTKKEEGNPRNKCRRVGGGVLKKQRASRGGLGFLGAFEKHNPGGAKERTKKGQATMKVAETGKKDGKEKKFAPQT